VLHAARGSAPGVLVEVARGFSPRIEIEGPCEIALDLGGLTRLFGERRTLGGELRRAAADRGLCVRVAIAGTRTAARLLVRHRAGLTVVEPEATAAALAPLPVTLLAEMRGAGLEARDAGPGDSGGTRDLVRTLHRWGLRTLGDLASLPAAEVAARLGQAGVLWQRLARGEDLRPLVPTLPDERFEQALDLEWPIEGLEPLSFVLGRLLEPLSAELERRGRGAVGLRVRLHLVTREVHERALRLPVPMREARALRTLALLDFESHPPAAAIDRVTVAVDPAPGRRLQLSLLARPLPAPEQIATLTARLQALVGEDRCGSPALVDSWRPDAYAMTPFAPADPRAARLHERRRRGDSKTEMARDAASRPVVALRRFRAPVPARVRVEHDRPVALATDRRGLGGGRVVACAGPWRTSGHWWREGWDRDEWDVSLGDGATYRVFRARGAEAWFVEGIVD
jgi:protein ImuB